MNWAIKHKSFGSKHCRHHFYTQIDSRRRLTADPVPGGEWGGRPGSRMYRYRLSGNFQIAEIKAKCHDIIDHFLPASWTPRSRHCSFHTIAPHCLQKWLLVWSCQFLQLDQLQRRRFYCFTLCLSLFIGILSLYIKIPAFGVRVKGKHQYFHAEGNFGFSQCYPLINLRCTRLYKQLKTLIAASKVLYKHTIYTLEVENAKNILCRKID